MKGTIKVVLSITYALMGAEVFLRVLSPVAVFPRYVTAAPYGIRVNEPNRRYWHISPDVSVEFRVNAKGIRSDEEIPYTKPPGVKRIVVLGDSFAMGYEVSLEDMFVTQMERELQKAGINVQVVNLSVSGHSNAEELITLQAEGLKYQPDLVLLCWHASDYPENVRSSLFTLDQGELKRKNATYLPGVATQRKLCHIPGYEWVSSHSQLYSWVRETVAIRVVKPLLLWIATAGAADTARAEPGEAGSAQDAYAVRLTVALLKETERIARSAGAKFLILDIPVGKGRSVSKSVFSHDDNGGTFGLPVVNPVEALRQHTGELLYWERGHGHFTPLGCRIMGEALARRIIEDNLLGGKRP